MKSYEITGELTDYVKDVLERLDGPESYTALSEFRGLIASAEEWTEVLARPCDEGEDKEWKDMPEEQRGVLRDLCRERSHPSKESRGPFMVYGFSDYIECEID